MSLQSGCDDGKPPTFFEDHPMFWPDFWIILNVIALIGSTAYFVLTHKG